jgi:hypothetical protein
VGTATGVQGRRVQGEIGLVVSNARMGIPVLELPHWAVAPLSLSGVGGDPASGAAAGAAKGRTHVVSLVTQGTFAFIDLPDRRIAAVNVTLFDGSPAAAVPAILATSDEVSALDAGPGCGLWMELGDWQPFADAGGATLLPLQQTLRLVTRSHNVTVAFQSHASDFVRLPVRYRDSFDNGAQKYVSDFRASFSSAFISIAEKTGKENDAPWEVLFEGFTPHNAIEFAFHAPFTPSADNND